MTRTIGHWIERMARDVRYAIRVLLRQWHLTGAAVVTLSVGIAATACAFTLVSRFVFRTPTTQDPQRYFRVATDDGRAAGVATVSDYLTVRAQATSAETVAAWSTDVLRADLGPADSTPLQGLLVSCNFFQVVGVRVAITGRLLSEADCTSDAPVAVISETLWRRQFASDPSVVANPIQYGRVAVTVVGVAAVPPIQLQAHDPDGDFAPDLWLPYTSQRLVKDQLSLLSGRDLLGERNAFPWLEIAGLLAPGVSRSEAQAQFRVIRGRQAGKGPWAGATWRLTDGSRWAATPRKMLGVFMIALAVPALVLVMACVNVASLLLSRIVARRREIAVMLALGASRAAIARMLLLESALLATTAVAAAMWSVLFVPPLMVGMFDAERWVGSAATLRADLRVFAFMAAVGTLTAVLAGLAPVVESWRTRLTAVMQTSRPSGGRRGVLHVRSVFIAVQVAGAMVALITAVAFASTVSRVMTPGFAVESLLVAELPGQAQVPAATVVDGVRTLPGVASAAYTSTLPIVSEGALPVRIAGGETTALVPRAVVSSTYFDVLGIPLLAGRSFTPGDHVSGGPAPAVVSAQFARRFFGGTNALGHVVETGEAAAGRRMLVIGVAGDRRVGLAGSTETVADGSVIYELMSPSSSSGFIVVRTTGPAKAVADSLVKSARQQLGVVLPLRTFHSVLANRVQPLRRLRNLLTALGAIALLLALVGVMGAASFDVNQRRKEYAIHQALGAAPSAVRRRIVVSGLRPWPVGLALGVLLSWAALAVTDSQRILPIGSVATDPSSYIVVSLLLVGTALLTLLGIAYPASRRAPIDSLRLD